MLLVLYPLLFWLHLAWTYIRLNKNLLIDVESRTVPCATLINSWMNYSQYAPTGINVFGYDIRNLKYEFNRH